MEVVFYENRAEVEAIVAEMLNIIRENKEEEVSPFVKKHGWAKRFLFQNQPHVEKLYQLVSDNPDFCFVSRKVNKAFRKFLKEKSQKYSNRVTFTSSHGNFSIIFSERKDGKFVYGC